MIHRFSPTLAAILATLALAGCSTIDDVVAYGKGPFDQSPATTSQTALEGLHESSWGNSGRWGAQEPDGNETSEGMSDGNDSSPADSVDPEPPAAPGE